jgi:hypothetical protein
VVKDSKEDKACRLTQVSLLGAQTEKQPEHFYEGISTIRKYERQVLGAKHLVEVVGPVQIFVRYNRFEHGYIFTLY